jgi:hypothetical protein
LLLPQILPVCSVVLPCQPGAALRDLALPQRRQATRRGWFVATVLVTTTAYLALAFAGADTTGGKSLGPRLLLPIMPLLAIVAIGTLVRYLTAKSPERCSC